MTVSPRAELLVIQKRLWRWNRELIDHSILVREVGFDSYERNYRRAVRDYERISNQDEMLGAILRSDVIYVGDYHTCNQSQRSFLRVLKATVKDEPKFAVGLELIHKRHQSTLDNYLAGRVSEEAFLRRIELREHWVFDLWDNFKPLFDFCKYHDVPMYAIDAASRGADVRRRDAASAKVVCDILTKYPGRRLFVFIGDLHIAPQHLPRDVSIGLSQQGVKRSSLILYQNSEQIYWKLAEQGADDYVEVVRFSDGNFCRMHTPPVVCQRSYLNWLEHEEGEIDYADAKASFLEFVDRICDFLDIKLDQSHRDEVEVFTCGDLSFLKKLSERGDFSEQEIKIIKDQILASESYYIAKAKFVYLANLSVNHAAEEAAHFIKGACSGVESPREIIDAFYANALHEALGFFGSKLINHKRKCYHEKDYKNLLSYFQTVRVPRDRRLEYETAHLVVECKKLENRKKTLSQAEIFRGRTDLFLSITHALGYMLGDRMYYGLVGRAISKDEIRKLFVDPWVGDGEPARVYMNLINCLKSVKMPKRM